VRIIFEILR